MAKDNVKRESQRHRRKRIAIDFDGVLHKYSKKWHDGTIYDDPVPGAVGVVRSLARDYDLIVFTAREQPQAIHQWIWKHFDMNIPVTNSKPHADMYIDDRGHHFTDWNSTLNEILRRSRRDFETERKWQFG